MRSIPLTRLLRLLLCCAALLGALAVGPAAAGAAEGEEPTTTTEEPPPIEVPPVEVPPVEVELPTQPETPVTSPPGNSPPPSEAPSSEPSRGGDGTTTNTGAGTTGGGGSVNQGDSGSAAAPATGTVGGSTTRSHPRSHTTRSTAGSGGGDGGGGNAGSGSKGGGGTGPQHSSHAHAPSSGGGSSEPTVSPTDVTQGAEAFSNVASHVGEVFAEALPTKPLQEIGAKVLSHAGIVPAGGGKAQKQAVDRIGKALGTALIGSAVAVDRKPPATARDPLSFIVAPPGGKSGTVYVIGILALLLIAALLIGREVRKALGFGTPRAGLTVMDHEAKGRRRAARARRRNGPVWSTARFLRARGMRAARRLRTQAFSGLRSMF